MILRSFILASDAQIEFDAQIGTIKDASLDISILVVRRKEEPVRKTMAISI